MYTYISQENVQYLLINVQNDWIVNCVDFNEYTQVRAGVVDINIEISGRPPDIHVMETFLYIAGLL